MTESLELQILERHSAGKKNREIARELNIHHNTVAYWLKQNGLKANYFGQSIDMVSETHARCRKCNQIKLLSEYQFGRKGKQYEYRFSFCNDCRKKQIYLNLNNDINKFLADRFNRTKRRAKKLNIPFNISKEEFINQFNKQDGLCFYTDDKMICEVGSDLHRDSMSIDKIIPSKGYVGGNVVFTTHRINTCKNDLSLKEIQTWMPDWHKRVEKFLEKAIMNYNIDTTQSTNKGFKVEITIDSVNNLGNIHVVYDAQKQRGRVTSQASIGYTLTRIKEEIKDQNDFNQIQKVVQAACKLFEEF